MLGMTAGLFVAHLVHTMHGHFEHISDRLDDERSMRERIGGPDQGGTHVDRLGVAAFAYVRRSLSAECVERRSVLSRLLQGGVRSLQSDVHGAGAGELPAIEGDPEG